MRIIFVPFQMTADVNEATPLGRGIASGARTAAAVSEPQSSRSGSRDTGPTGHILAGAVAERGINAFFADKFLIGGS